MNVKDFIALFLTVTFVLHGGAFTALGFIRRKKYYFLLTGTFTLLTAVYFIKFEGWDPKLPGSSFPATWLLRIGAVLFTLTYLRIIYGEEGSWLWRLKRQASQLRSFFGF